MEKPLRCVLGFHVGGPEVRNGFSGFYCERCETFYEDPVEECMREGCSGNPHYELWPEREILCGYHATVPNPTGIGAILEYEPDSHGLIWDLLDRLRP